MSSVRVDAHLDLAHNVLDVGLDLTLPLEELRRRHSVGDLPTVTLPALVFATLFASPYHPEHNPKGYRTPDEATIDCQP